MVLNERTRFFPEPETETIVVRPTSKVENNSENDEANYGDDLDRRKDEFSFPVCTCWPEVVTVDRCEKERWSSPAPKKLMKTTTIKQSIIHSELRLVFLSQ